LANGALFFLFFGGELRGNALKGGSGATSATAPEKSGAGGWLSPCRDGKI